MAITSEDILPLVNRYHQRLRDTSCKFKRYLFNQINWNARIIGIKGARGVGKTTLLLQHILENYKDPDETIYVSLDDMWFSGHSLEDFVEFVYARGVRTIYIDEVHTYPNWSRLLKNFYDTYADLRIRYTGSALLSIDNSIVDLSRRQTLYDLNGMSFREYLGLNELGSYKSISIHELLENHVRLAMDISSHIPVLRYFEQYLRHGYYPFYRDNPEDFEEHLSSIIKLVIEVDVPSVEDISQATVAKLKQLMVIIAENAPLEPNISRLAEKLECSRELCVKMLYLLQRAKLILLAFKSMNNYKQMRGPDKILGGDPNVLHALYQRANIGTLRETFFVNQMQMVSTIELAKKGDFILDNKYTFEIGGANKKYSQIADVPDSYLAIDNLSVGYGARIPLYLFGFLY